MIAYLASALWIIGLLLLFAGDTVFQTLELPEPTQYTWIKQNKFMFFIIIFFINNLGNSMLATGAFEVYVDDQLIFSKLASKRLPTADDIVLALQTVGI